MKCMPITWSGRFVTAPIWVIEMLEVFEARIVAGGAIASSCSNTRRLSATSSLTASTTTWQLRAASSEVPPWMRR